MCVLTTPSDPFETSHATTRRSECQRVSLVRYCSLTTASIRCLGRTICATRADCQETCKCSGELSPLVGDLRRAILAALHTAPPTFQPSSSLLRHSSLSTVLLTRQFPHWTPTFASIITNLVQYNDHLPSYFNHTSVFHSIRLYPYLHASHRRSHRDSR